MEGKKISFGFKKVKKAEKPLVDEQKDFIECVEEKSIKVVGGDKVVEKEPLVIPLKPNTLITAEKLREIAAKVESSLEEPDQIEIKEDIKIEPVENETLDQMAIRELLQDTKKEVKVETQALTVPIPAKPVIDGQKESTLDDYESVPIQDFGLAMLRGMGWTPDQEKANKYKQPQLRPKGLGLGADKVIADKQKKKTASKNGKEEELAIIKNSYVKVVAGKHSGYYGKVVSLDEDNGRVMVEITVKKETVSLSEFMMQPVTKAEFDKESKVINTDAYEEYRKREQSKNQRPSHNSPQVNSVSRKDSPKASERQASSSKQNDSKKNRRRDDGYNGRDRRQDRRDSLSSEDRSKTRDRCRRDSSSADRDDRRTERSRRELSEDRSNRKKEKTKRISSEERIRRRNKEKLRRDSSESEDRGSRKYKSKSKRNTSEDRDSKRQKEKYKREVSSEEDQSRKKKEKDKKRYTSNDSISSLSDTEKKKKHKNKNCRRQKDSSDSESDLPKRDKRDIDKKRKGKKKKRDRDRSPNYKKHRK